MLLEPDPNTTDSSNIWNGEESHKLSIIHIPTAMSQYRVYNHPEDKPSSNQLIPARTVSKFN